MRSPGSGEHPGERPRRSYLVILGLLTTAGISFAFMQTLVVPALPFFQREFDTTASWVAWIATGFLLSSSVLTPILGKLGDAYGKKRLLVISLVIFGAASIGAAFAWNLASLVAFRVLQGTGAAIFPLSFGIIRDEFPPEKVGVGIGTVSSVFGVGGGIGLVMSGVILETLSWPWLFLVGAIPVLAAAVLIAMLVPESRAKTPTKPDLLGAATLSLALVALLLGLSEGNSWGWTSAGVLGLLAVAVVSFVAWVRIERRVREPLVDIAMLSRRGMAVTNAATLLIGVSMFSNFILLPGFVQAPRGLPPELGSVLGYGFNASPIAVGLFFVPSSVAMVIAGPIAGAVGTRFGPALPLRVGAALMAMGMALLALVHGEPWSVYAWMTLMGVGISCALAAAGALVISNSNPRETGVASGMNTIMRTVGAAFGGQIAAAMVTAQVIDGTSVPAESGYTLAFGLSALAALGALAITFLFVPRGRGPARRARSAEPALASR